jgi:hypothetical protein
MNSIESIETLERRVLLDGNVSAALTGGDLVLSGDRQDNHVQVIRQSASTVRVAGLDDTTVNGRRSRDFAASFDDLKILMRQGGEDHVAVQGPIRLPGDLDAEMGDGEMIVEGSAGRVEIVGNLDVQGGGACDVRLRNDVVVDGDTTIKAGGEVTAHANLGILPDFASARFGHSLRIDNSYFPLVPGTKYTSEERSVDQETDEVTIQKDVYEVTNQTRTILGVPVRVVRDRVFEEGRLIEDTFDWHAQDDNGNVWYFGEDTTEFEYDDNGKLIGSSKEGSWTAGVDGAKPGVIMEAQPRVGDRYYQEFKPDGVLDQGEILATNVTATVPVGTFHNVVRTRETTVMEPDTLDNKLYAPGLGIIREESYDLQSNELTDVVRLQSVTLNGKKVTQVVSPTGFTGVNPTGKSTGPVRLRGDVSIRADDQVILRQARLSDNLAIIGKAEVSLVDTVLDDEVTIRATDSVGFRNVTANRTVSIRGDDDATFLSSRLRGDVDILFGAGDNELVLKNSTFTDLDADGGPGDNTFEDLGGNHVDELELTRFGD